MSVTVCCILPANNESRYWLQVFGGFFRLCLCRLVDAITTAGSRSKMSATKSSGAIASIPYLAKSAGGKSRKFSVTMRLAPERIAQASTWRSGDHQDQAIAIQKLVARSLRQDNYEHGYPSGHWCVQVDLFSDLGVPLKGNRSIPREYPHSIYHEINQSSPDASRD